MKSLKEWRTFKETNNELITNIVVAANHFNILLQQLVANESTPREVSDMTKRIEEQVNAMIKTLETLTNTQ